MNTNNLFDFISNVLGFVVDSIEFIGILVGLGAILFGAILPIARPIKAMLKLYKIPFKEAFWAIWKCRTNPKLFIRFYVESAIFHTEGKEVDKETWHDLRGIFLNRLSQFSSTGEFIIEVDSVAVMISSDVKDMIAEYFAFLSGERECRDFWTKANVDKDKLRKDAFCSVVKVHNGYLAPLARIAGINDRYEEDWNDILKNFAATYEKNSLVPKEYLSYTYTWLMWGPSIQTSPLEADDTDVLGIYGVGDEANSFFVSIPKKKYKDLFTKGQMCEAATISGHIVNPLTYVNEHATRFNPNSIPFMDRIQHQYKSDKDYIFDIDDYEDEVRHKHYFTAYVWGMFLAVRKGADPVYNFADSIAFFEHTNLSDHNRDSLRGVYLSLARKFKEFFNNDPRKDIEYHFVAAVSEDTGAVLKEELKGMKRVKFKEAFKSNQILAAIDAHFNSASWGLLPESAYGDLIPLYYSSSSQTGLKGLTEIFRILSSETSAVIAIRTRLGELDAASIAEIVDGKYEIVKSIKRAVSTLGDEEVRDFGDREIRAFIESK